MKIEMKNIKVFGYGLAVILAFMAWRFWAKHINITWVPICVTLSVLFLFVTQFRPESLIPFYKRWMKVAHFIGSIVTFVILSVLFYFIFGVVGIVLRLLRKDLLDESIDVKATSYWQKRPHTEFSKERAQKQF